MMSDEKQSIIKLINTYSMNERMNDRLFLFTQRCVNAQGRRHLET